MSMTYELLSSTEPKMAEAQNMDLSKEEEYTAPEHCTQMEESNKASKKTAKRKIQFDLPKEGNSSKQKEDKKTTASTKKRRAILSGLIKEVDPPVIGIEQLEINKWYHVHNVTETPSKFVNQYNDDDGKSKHKQL